MTTSKKFSLEIEAQRREFIKTTALGATGIAFGIPLVGCGGGSSSVSSSPTPTISSSFVMASSASEGRIQRSWNNPNQFSFISASGSTATFGSNRLDLNAAQSVVLMPDGSFWIADAGNKRLLHLSSNLAVLGSIATIGGVQLITPMALAVLPDGRLVVGDIGLEKIAITNGAGSGSWYGTSLLASTLNASTFSWKNQPANVLDNPKVIRVSSDSTILVLDTAACRLVLFNSSGSVLSTIPLTGKPSGFAIAPDNTVYVCDASSKKLVSFPLSNPSAITTIALPEKITPYRLTWQGGTNSSISNLIVSSLT
jgi:sugar lactone lactonase YvrE